MSKTFRNDNKDQDENYNLIEISKQEVLAEAAQKAEMVRFGPCLITSDAWRRLKMVTKVYSSQPSPKDIKIVPLGQHHHDNFIIKDFIEVSGENRNSYPFYSMEDVKKIENESLRNGLTAVGMLHTHLEPEPKPSHQDHISWLAMMLRFNRPLIYFILTPETLRLGSYSIPTDIFTQLREAIRYVPLADPHEKVELVRFGPCFITPDAWRRLKMVARAHSSPLNPKEVTLLPLGQHLHDRFLIKDFIQLQGESGRSYSLYTVEDVKKVEAEAERNGLMVIGTLHTHPKSDPKPSRQDRISWLAMMFEFNRPLIYFILDPETLQLGAYSIPPEVFTQVREAVRFVSIDLSDKQV